ncbi:hypothetical protein AVEN_125408-1 [Araneus ventricosus]|uniref:BED-type domain-containing protein n=1 Tax=Araneus ventricosus TaxID=182803 RepID=A0A4Y2DWF8_ARAVE|nr:hypothetical protein AVEN_125408-1 [Araneus ventricosus]
MDKDNCAKFSLCSNMLKISKGSYKGLKIHLRTKQGIDLSSENSQLKLPNSDLFPKASTSKTDSVDIICEEEIAKKKSQTIDSYFEKENSMEKMVSKMLCKDDVALNLFCSSSDFRYLFSKRGF